ncbi:hypothetical protein A2160_04835 [Candidatus Beckwithbacteria bacterium RBG_13_42_9]|uniref:Uncharacterized protein n=1 Tax=Candidatus Beckwithbacteria bacterium RBG_13_42_9 TaxID=1797457 RepID=A0A1F5E5W5_9BACT|nr:MAG: hypothetical protein A2160_04835 [Candidatus Beckwithbacteria bacterium RBG_13_42_9]
MPIQFIELSPEIVHPELAANLSPIVKITVLLDGYWMGATDEGKAYRSGNTHSPEEMVYLKRAFPKALETGSLLVITGPGNDKIVTLAPPTSRRLWLPIVL